MSPTSTTLTLFELQQLVREYAADTERWRPHLRYPAPGEERWWARLPGPAGVDVWLLSWLPGHTTELHDHGDAGAAFAVVEGALTEVRPRPGAGRSRTEHHAGTSTTVPVDQVHDVIADRVAAVSIHAYSPPLSQMTYYREAPSGELEAIRTVITDDPEEGPRERSGQR